MCRIVTPDTVCIQYTTAVRCIYCISSSTYCCPVFWGKIVPGSLTTLRIQYMYRTVRTVYVHNLCHTYAPKKEPQNTYTRNIHRLTTGPYFHALKSVQYVLLGTGTVHTVLGTLLPNHLYNTSSMYDLHTRSYVLLRASMMTA